MVNFEVIWYNDSDIGTLSKVYAVDPINDRLLVVVNEYGALDWVPRARCEVHYDLFKRSI